MLKLFTMCTCPGCGRRYLRWWLEAYKPFCDQLCMKVHERRRYHAEVTDRAKELARMKRFADYKRRIVLAENAGKGQEADAIVQECLDVLNRPESTGGAS